MASWDDLPEHVRYFKLLQYKSAIELEMKGIKFRRSVAQHVRDTLGLKGNREKLIEQLKAKANDILEGRKTRGDDYTEYKEAIND